MNRIAIPDFVLEYISSCKHKRYVYQSTIRALSSYLATGVFAVAAGNDNIDPETDVICIENEQHLLEAKKLYGSYCKFIRLSWRDKYTHLGIDEVIEAKSYCRRPRYPSQEIALPLIPDRQNSSLPGFEPDKLEFQNRKYFATFKGKIYQHGKRGDCRQDLLSLETSDDLIVAPLRHKYDSYPADYDRYFVLSDLYSYEDLMNSQFGLVPRGRQPATYRLIECLKLGVVPIIYDSLEGLVLPFQEFIDWANISLFADSDIGAQSLSRTLQRARTMKSAEWHQRVREGLRVYEEYFSSHLSVANALVRAFVSKENARKSWSDYYFYVNSK
jgi:hypothetical protein